MKIRIPGAAVLASVFSLACGNTVTEPRELVVLRIEPTQAKFVPGDTIRVTLHNLGLKDLSYSTCGSNLERWSGSEWAPYTIGSGSSPACFLSITVLGPGESLRVTVSLNGAEHGVLPAQFAAGTYRVVIVGAAIAGEGGTLPRESAPFYFAGMLPD